MYAVIISQSATVSDITLLKTVKVEKIKSSEVTELFWQTVKMTVIKSEMRSEIKRIMKELRYLTLMITLIDLYMSVISYLLLNIERYLLKYQQQ